MHSKRKHLGVAVLDSVIYAVGGRDELSELNSVEKYVIGSSLHNQPCSQVVQSREHSLLCMAWE